VVFYAGHGDYQRADELYLLPVDADVRDLPRTAVSGEALRTRLGALPSSALLLLDACFAGSLDLKKRKTRALPGPADGLVRALTYDEGVVVLCGAAKEHEAIEEGGHGYFTQALVEGLSGQTKGPDAVPTRGRDGLVMLNRLEDYVQDRVPELSGGEQAATISHPSTVRSFALSKP
jgi:uncharacterized caspase-like protein